MTYDYLIVGSGLYGATFAYFAQKSGKKVLVIDKRNHAGGNIHCECIERINVHTSNKEALRKYALIFSVCKVRKYN